MSALRAINKGKRSTAMLDVRRGFRFWRLDGVRPCPVQRCGTCFRESDQWSDSLAQRILTANEPVGQPKLLPVHFNF